MFSHKLFQAVVSAGCMTRWFWLRVRLQPEHVFTKGKNSSIVVGCILSLPQIYCTQMGVSYIICSHRPSHPEQEWNPNWSHPNGACSHLLSNGLIHMFNSREPFQKAKYSPVLLSRAYLNADVLPKIWVRAHFQLPILCWNILSQTG